MGDPHGLTDADYALFRDIDDKKVADDEDGTPMLDLPDGTRTRVADAVWGYERAGWAYQIPDGLGWRLTQRGLDILEGRR